MGMRPRKERIWLRAVEWGVGADVVELRVL